MVIYGLIDPRDGKLRYVGQTKYPSQRLQSHLRYGKNYVSRKQTWINKLKKLNLQPTMEILEHGPIDADEAEMQWIAFFRTIGIDLLNGTKGGESGRLPGFHHDEETKRKIGLANSGKTLSREAKARISATKIKNRVQNSQTLKRVMSDPAIRAKMSASKMGHEVSEETRKKISQKLKGKPWSQARIDAQKRKDSGVYD